MTAPFRIERPVAFRSGATGGGDEFKEYLGRLLKMIPAEVLGVYTIGTGFIPDAERLVEAIWSFVCLILVAVVRLYGTADPAAGKGPQGFPVVVSVVAFVIWVYSLGGPFAAYGLHVPYVGSLAILLWTFVIPIFYKGD